MVSPESAPDRLRQRPTPTMAFADFCPITATVAGCRAIEKQRHVEQISPDKNVNYCYTTAAFTLAS